MLARFGTVMRPEIPAAKDETIDVLAELLAARRGLVKDRTAVSNRGKGLTLAMLKRQCQQHRKQIDSQIEAIDREWMSILAANPTLKARLDILLSIPGIGAATAIALLVDMPELGTMDAKQAASLAGPRLRRGKPGTGDPAIRNLEGQELHSGRPCFNQARHLYACPRRHPVQPSTQGEIRSVTPGRKTPEGRHRRHHAKDRHHRQRADPG
jgi:hypothetical protein